jgi:glucan-binding YG repeat protein
MQRRWKNRVLSWLRKGLVVTAMLGLTFGTAAVRPVWASDKAVETVWLGQPTHVWWETDTQGKWTSVKRAHEYQVKLYIADNADRDEDNPRAFNPNDEGLEAVVTVRTNETSYDFSEYMNDLHSYFFVVRATPKISEQAYVQNGDWVASKDVDYRGKQIQGVTGGKWRNYLEGSRYEDADGNLLGSGWNLVSGEWYLMDEKGYRQTGWQTVDGKRYYLGDDGRMATGWFVYEDQWYYAGKDGELQTGWIMPTPGYYYYLDESGVMLHDTVVDGYQLGADGLRGAAVKQTEMSQAETDSSEAE